MGHCWTKQLSKGNYDEDQCPIAELASGRVHLITTMDKWEDKVSEANRDGKVVVVNFGTSWCTPCRSIAADYIQLADKYPSMIFLKVDVEELAEFSQSWDIKATPTFFFLKDGQEVDKLVGANKPELQKKAMAIAESRMSHN